jgi:hypothetical protein
MSTPPTPAEAEARLRRFLEEHDLPQPDEVEHHAGELLLLYHDQKVALVFEFDEETTNADTP